MAHRTHTDGVMDMLTNCTVVIILQYIANDHIVYIKIIQCWMPIISPKAWKTKTVLIFLFSPYETGNKTSVETEKACYLPFVIHLSTSFSLCSSAPSIPNFPEPPFPPLIPPSTSHLPTTASICLLCGLTGSQNTLVHQG